MAFKPKFKWEPRPVDGPKSFHPGGDCRCSEKPEAMTYYHGYGKCPICGLLRRSRSSIYGFRTEPPEQRKAEP